MGRIVEELQDELVTQVLAQQAVGNHVLLSGPHGTGHDHLMREVATRLSSAGDAFLQLNCSDPAAAQSTLDSVLAENEHSGGLLLVDDLEHADLTLLRSMLAFADRSGTLISALTTSNRDSLYTRSFQQLLAEAPSTQSHLSSLHRLRLTPINPASIELLLHNHSPQPLNAGTVQTICRLAWGRLAWGRLAWALDLLTIAQAGAFTSNPHTAISTQHLTALSLPGMHSAARTIGELNPEDAAAAIALSEIEPLDPVYAADLAGDTVINTLLHRGVLLQAPDSELYTVPAFLAAAIHHYTTPEALQQARHRTASQLLTQESLGLPLSETDAAFCAHTLSADDLQPDGWNPLSLAQTRVLRRTAAGLLAFGGEGSARALLLRAANLGVKVDGAFQTRALTALGEPRRALAALVSEVPGAASASTDSTSENGANQGLSAETLSDRLDRSFLLAQLSAEAHAPLERVLLPEQLPTHSDPAESSAWSVFELWNRTDSIASQLDVLRRTAEQHPIPEVALAAETLLGLEEVRLGEMPSRDYRNDHRIQMMRAGLGPQQPHQDILGAITLGHALLLAFTGELGKQHEELRALVSYLSFASYHRRWLQHLLAAETALACGNAERAALEWGMVEQHIPRFTPLRLRAHLREFGETLERVALKPQGVPGARGPAKIRRTAPRSRMAAIRAAARTTGRLPALHHAPAPHGSAHRAPSAERAAQALLNEGDATVLSDTTGSSDTAPLEWLVRYLCDRENPFPKSQLNTQLRPTALPLLRIAEAHATASHAQNPAELMRIAAFLEASELWVPALDALTEARNIYVRRRAGGATARCDARIHTVKTSLQEHALWYQPDETTEGPRVRLTPRERETAQLAATGLSNQKIAEQLGCRTRTVESHLSQARTKLGAKNHRELRERLRSLEG